MSNYQNLPQDEKTDPPKDRYSAQLSNNYSSQVVSIFANPSDEDSDEAGSEEASAEGEITFIDTHTRNPSHNQVVDWSARFRTIEAKEDSMEKFDELATLAKDFVFVAEIYGRIIISEGFLNDDEKTIAPVTVGGIAGGAKYICEGILYKFILDSEVQPGLWMYGGSIRNDEKAAKAACNERKGLLAYYGAKRAVISEKRLNFPLMSLIHYRGFCLIAMSILPVTKETIRYGSCDGGLTVHADDEILNELMEQTARDLNLAPHTVGDSTLYGPGDIEGHLGTDNEYYVLDYGRVMPPEAPNLKEDSNPRCIFYNLLRPALVHQYGESLCSDTFTGWMKDEKKRFRTYEERLINATKALLHQQIPKLANQLDNTFSLSPEEDIDLVDLNLVSETHRWGINCRHMGRLRSKCTNDYVRRAILIECLARTMKNLVRQKLRDKMKELKISTDSPYKQLVYEFLEPVLYNVQPLPKQFVTSHEDVVCQHDICCITSSCASDIIISTDVPIPSNSSIYCEVKFEKLVGDIVFGLWITKRLKSVNLGNIKSGMKQDIQVYQNNEGSPNYYGLMGGRCWNGVTWDAWSPVVGEGDIVGMHYDRDSNSMRFTKNGVPIGTTIAVGKIGNINALFYPVVKVTNNSILYYNFGPRFSFNVQAYCNRLGMRITPVLPKKKETQEFWKKTIKSELLQRFPKCLSSKEKSEKYNLRHSVNMFLLMKQFQKMTGILLSTRAVNTLEANPEGTFSLYLHDVDQFNPRVSHMGIIDFVEVVSMFRLKDNPPSTMLLHQALSKMTAVVDTAGDNYPIHYYFWGLTYYHLAENTQDPKRKLYFLREAEKKYAEITDSRNLSGSSHDKYFTWCFTSMAKVLLEQNSLMNLNKKGDNSPRSGESTKSSDDGNNILAKATAKISAAYSFNPTEASPFALKELKQIKQIIERSTSNHTVDFKSLVYQAEAIVEGVPRTETNIILAFLDIVVRLLERFIHPGYTETTWPPKSRQYIEMVQKQIRRLRKTKKVSIDETLDSFMHLMLQECGYVENTTVAVLAKMALEYSKKEDAFKASLLRNLVKEEIPRIIGSSHPLVTATFEEFSRSVSDTRVTNLLKGIASNDKIKVGEYYYFAKPDLSVWSIDLDSGESSRITTLPSICVALEAIDSVLYAFCDKIYSINLMALDKTPVCLDALGTGWSIVRHTCRAKHYIFARTPTNIYRLDTNNLTFKAQPENWGSGLGITYMKGRIYAFGIGIWSFDPDLLDKATQSTNLGNGWQEFIYVSSYMGNLFAINPQSGILFLVDHNLRLDERWQQASDLVASADSGRLALVSGSRTLWVFNWGITFPVEENLKKVVENGVPLGSSKGTIVNFIPYSTDFETDPQNGRIGLNNKLHHKIQNLPNMVDNIWGARCKRTALEIPYFEVTLLYCAGTKDQCAIGIGYGSPSFPEKCFPGWQQDPASFGWHSDNGGLYRGITNNPDGFVDTWGVGDTVGIGIVWGSLPNKGDIYITKNGRLLGLAWKDIDIPQTFHPVIALMGGYSITYNIGSSPFQNRDHPSSSTPLVTTNSTPSIVAKYERPSVAWCLQNAQCTYLATRQVHSQQFWYYCITCWPDKKKGVCQSCANNCHKKHNLQSGNTSSFYCDCGELRDCSCLDYVSMMKDSIQEKKCTYRDTKKFHKPQIWFNCFTCKMIGGTGCCAGCIQVCHLGHKISEPISSKAFFCDCGDSGRCKALV